jgi:hypothetical protein
VQTTQTPAAEEAVAEVRPSFTLTVDASQAKALWRRSWPVLGALLAVLLWWPAGFWGIGEFPHLPLRAVDGDRLLLGAIAAAATAAMLARSGWWRLLVVVGYSAGGWVLDAPARDTYLDEWQVLAALLALGGVVGLIVGARGHRGARGVATVLAVVAGVSPATWPHGLPLAVALALPFAAVPLKRLASAVVGAAGVLATWLVAALLARALAYGWAVLRPGAAAGTLLGELGRVLSASWDFVRDQWWRYTQGLLQDTLVWFVLAGVLAVVLVAARGFLATSGEPRRSPAGSSSHPGS